MIRREMFLVCQLAAWDYVNDSAATMAQALAAIRYAEEALEVFRVLHKICTTGPAGFALFASAARAATFLATA
jgi:hypothetical protein